MAHRFLNTLMVRLRFGIAHIQAVPLLAFLLVAVTALAQLFWLPAREAAVRDNEQRLAGLESKARELAIERQSLVVSPDETRQRLLARYPGEAQLNAQLGRLLELSADEGLQVVSGEYQLIAAKEALFNRYVLNLPVKGEYRKIRRYVQAVREAFPDLAVEEISLHRENIAAGEVEARLRFVILGRRSTT